MAGKPEIQYIRYYIDGTAARKPEPQLPNKPRKPLPRKKRRAKYVLKVQPLAVLGILLSVVLLWVMAGGVLEFLDAQDQLQRMQNHVTEQRNENAALRQHYESQINLEDIHRAALALGMVPEDQVRHITISVPMEQSAPEVGFLTTLAVVIPGYFE